MSEKIIPFTKEQAEYLGELVRAVEINVQDNFQREFGHMDSQFRKFFEIYEPFLEAFCRKYLNDTDPLIKELNEIKEIRQHLKKPPKSNLD